MPQHRSAEKRVRQNSKKRLRNVQKRSKMKTAIKKVKAAPDKETALVEFKKAVSLLDRMAVKGIIHRNNAANIKSKLMRHVKAM